MLGGAKYLQQIMLISAIKICRIGCGEARHTLTTTKRELQVPVTARDTGDLLRPGYLEAVNSLADYLLFNFTVPCGDDDVEESQEIRCSFDDLCEGQCNDNQVSETMRNELHNWDGGFRCEFVRE